MNEKKNKLTEIGPREVPILCDAHKKLAERFVSSRVMHQIRRSILKRLSPSLDEDTSLES